MVESGFANRTETEAGKPLPPSSGDIDYGVIVENPCPQAAVNAQLSVLALDARGNPIEDENHIGDVGEPRHLTVLLPGQRIGVAGVMTNGRGSASSPLGGYDATKVKGIKVVVVHADWQPADQAAPQVTASATGTRVGVRGADGFLPITFTLAVTPAQDVPNGLLSIVLRDGSGKIVSGGTRDLPPESKSPGDTVHTSVWVPANVPGLHAEVYVVPGGF